VTDNTEALAARLIESHAVPLELAVCRGIEKWGSFCESPIEALLLAALTWQAAMNSWSASGIPPVRVMVDPPRDKALCITIVPQFKWQGYRIDFAIFLNSDEPEFFVECDGHDFHERTPAQAERDRSKDRQIQAAGFPIIRFTGREIYRDCGECALQVFEFFGIRARTGVQMSAHPSVPMVPPVGAERGSRKETRAELVSAMRELRALAQNAQGVLSHGA
jgi:very-short-patch-repair endonuclease